MRPRTRCLIIGVAGLTFFVGCRESAPPVDGGASPTAVAPLQSTQTTPVTVSKLEAVPTSELIDRLVDLTSWNYGIRTNIIAVGEHGGGRLPEGLLMMQDPDPVPSEAVQEIVRRGALAVPELVAHLGDTRPTKVPIAESMPSNLPSSLRMPINRDFAYEYDFNSRTTKAPPGVWLPSGRWLQEMPTSAGIGKPSDQAIEAALEDQMLQVAKRSANLRMPKVYAVGDICFDLLGRIVNRQFESVRYQPSMCLEINCPSVLKEVREAATQEWGGLTPELHRQRLLDDAARPDEPSRAEKARQLLERYYPGTPVPGPSGK